MQFNQLGIIEPILKALHDEGYRTPTPIQMQAIPIVLEGKDLLGVAQTGTGKTAAFAIPIIQHLSTNKPQREPSSGGAKGPAKKRRIRSLILTPTRELAIQIEQSFKAYGRNTPLTSTVIFGGVKQGQQTNALRRGVDIVIATPGRLLDLMEQGYVALSGVEMFVLDEADRMLDMGFVRDVERILDHLPRVRQSLFFSATMPPSIVKLSNEILFKPERVEVTPVASTVDLIQQELYYVEKSKKLPLLMELLKDPLIKTALVFTRTKHGADGVVRTLERNRISCSAIHGNKAQNARQRALEEFKAQRIRVLVATDIAARGIDVDDLEYVINFEIPNVPETYVHRIGRTGRAGAAGSAFSFCSPDEKLFVRDIEKLIGKRIPVVHGHPFAKQQTEEEIKWEESRSNADRKRGSAPKRSLLKGRPMRHSAPRGGSAAAAPAPAGKLKGSIEERIAMLAEQGKGQSKRPESARPAGGAPRSNSGPRKSSGGPRKGGSGGRRR